MADMHPASISEVTTSHAERRLFTKMRDELPSDFDVVHSLGLTTHRDKPWAEIDFVVVCADGVYCIEVKGGHITRQDRRWYTNGKRLSHSPFEQAGGGAAALHHDLRDHFSFMKRCAVGWGVAFPDVRFSIDGPDIDLTLVYDDGDLARPFSVYLSRLVKRWRQRLTDIRGSWDPRPLSPADRRRVLDRLGRDFDLAPSLRADIAGATTELVRLTEQQASALRGLADCPRVLVRGGAGSGKTMLAAAEARRQNEEGKRVLLCCYNRQLAAYLIGALADESKIDVEHLHGLMARVIAEQGAGSRLPPVEPADLFTKLQPELCTELLLDRDPAYDVLIVDELQDLLLDGYVDVFDALLEGGLKSGGWRMFYDPLQNMFGASDPEALRRLEGCSPALYRLQYNCRNTAPIATQTALMSGINPVETLVVDGPPVAVDWYEGKASQRAVAARRIRRWLEDRIPPEEIMILASRRLPNTCLAAGLPANLRATLFDVSDDTKRRPKGAIGFSTIGAFKGLEADAVLLLDIDDLATPRALAQIYVGSSRPRAVLAVMLAERARATYDNRAIDYGERLHAAANDARVRDARREPL